MDIGHLRREYAGKALEQHQLAASPMQQFGQWFAEAQRAEITDANAMTLATVTPELQPAQRVVLLKRFDEQGFVFFTNLESRKAQHIAHNAQVCLHFAWLPLDRQVIVSGHAERVSAAEALQYFVSRPRGSQLAAWISNQSRPISTRAILEEKFAEISRKFANGEVPLPAFWGGYRVTPASVEFWQGRENRLHDRMLYTRSKQDEWSVERLAP